MDEIKRHRRSSADLDLSENTKRFLRELFGESIGSPSAAKKLDAIIEMLRTQAGVAAELALVKEELQIVHQLVAEITSNPEKIKELSERIRNQVEALKSTQTKPEQET